MTFDALLAQIHGDPNRARTAAQEARHNTALALRVAQWLKDRGLVYQNARDLLRISHKVSQEAALRPRLLAEVVRAEADPRLSELSLLAGLLETDVPGLLKDPSPTEDPGEEDPRTAVLASELTRNLLAKEMFVGQWEQPETRNAAARVWDEDEASWMEASATREECYRRADRILDLLRSLAAG